MLEDAADEPQRLLAEVGILVAREQRLAALPDRHVHMHAGAVVALHGLGHEGRGAPVGVGDVVDDILVFLDRIGLGRERAEDQPEFVLVRGDLVVVLVHLHAHALHGREHLGAQVLRRVGRVHGEIAALDAGAVAHVARLILGVGVPGAVDRVDLERDLVHLHRETDVVEDEELGLGPEIGVVADPGRFQIGLGLERGRARIARIGLARVGLDDVAMDAERLFGIERVDVGRLGVGQELHVGLVDRLPAGDRGAVEHEALVEEILVDEIGHHGHMLEPAARVGEADVDVFDILGLHQFQNLLLAHLCVIPC